MLCGYLAVVEHVGDAKVAKHAAPGGFIANEDVGGFHVFVDEAHAMAGIQGLGHLANDGQDGVFVAFQVDAAHGTFGAMFHQLELTLLAFIVHGSVVVEIYHLAHASHPFHQLQHVGVKAGAWLIDLQQLAVT